MSLLRKHFKRALSMALGVGLGTVMGSVVIPRLFDPALYNVSAPPLLDQAILYFSISFSIGFAAVLFIEWLKNHALPNGS